MIDVLINSITQNSKQIEGLAKKVNFRFVLVGLGIFALAKVIKDQNDRLDSIEEELSELNTEGE